ncbi:MAG: putative nucleotidyltransferase substrate binding domain-containing protein [Geminicoccaceae bacterium]
MTGTAAIGQGLGSFLAQHHPFDLLPPEALDRLVAGGEVVALSQGDVLYEKGEPVTRFTIVLDGMIDVMSPDGELLNRFSPGEGIGARGILRDGSGPNRAVAGADTRALALPKAFFLELLETYPEFAHFFERLRDSADRKPIFAADTGDALITNQLGDIMTRSPVSVAPTATVQAAAALMRDRGISCLPVADAKGLVGLLTTSDIAGRVVALGLPAETPVAEVMTAEPLALPPEALVFDALLLMGERHIGHLPIVDKGELVGILTRTNLIRRQSISVAFLIGDINEATEIARLATVIADVPVFLAQLVGAGVEAFKVGQLVTSITDALTRRLLVLAEARLGPAPVPWLWLACGSQGRREQTGFSDQDNCLILDDAYDGEAHEAYFADLARFVSDGLDACGYYYCPGDMMATNPRWRVPLRRWREYFRGWIAQPDPMAQMLSSVMFDLRPIAGETALFAGLQRETLDGARRNSIFRAHMIANSLKHAPPLSLFQGFALIRSGEHRNTLDLKHSGVVPIVDLARVYALDGAIEEVNTRERLIAARAAGSLSEAGAGDLVDAYDLISRIRLEHQARQVRDGRKPDNFMAPSTLSALERKHLKDAFGVVKSMQAALRSRSA